MLLLAATAVAARGVLPLVKGEHKAKEVSEAKVQAENTTARNSKTVDALHNINIVSSDEAQVPLASADTILFPVKKTTPQSEDGDHPGRIDLKDPENLKTGVFYDDRTGTYRFGTKVGENFVETPFFMSPEDYQNWSVRREMQKYYNKKNREEAQSKGKQKFDFTDMKFDLGPANKIFGPGGVRILRAQPQCVWL